jgi:hypothetical protein
MSASPCPACPILADITHLTDLTQDIQRTMRKLRRDLNRCKACPAGEQCPVLQNYQAQVSQAIAEVLAELAAGG